MLGLPSKALLSNFSFAEFEKRYCQAGSPLARRAGSFSVGDIDTVDFSDWQVFMRPETIEEYIAEALTEQKLGAQDIISLRKLAGRPLLCCPEDLKCTEGCSENKALCLRCRFPVCRSCRVALQGNLIVPTGLASDNFYGYMQRWIHEVGVTWMEKTIASPFWTGMTIFSVSRRTGGRRHLLHDVMYQGSSRVAFKGQLFSVPMHWVTVLEQLD